MADAPPGGESPLVGGRFRIVGLLGAGATASVYEVWDVAAGRPAALKVLHPHLAGDQAAVAAFHREAQVIARVRHPALCGVIAWGPRSAEPVAEAWTAWDLAPGRTLSEIVRTEGPLDAVSAVAVAARVLDGLAELHAHGLVHRDVSPANIVVDRAPDGTVRGARLVDFGLTDAAGEHTRGADVLRTAAGDGVVGNAFYAAPEQLRGLPVGAAGDLYAVAGVVYFALVGAAPFARDTTEATVAAALDALPPTASVHAPGVPPAIDRALVRGLLKEPHARFTDAAEMRAALEAAVAARPAAEGREGRTRVLAPTAPLRSHLSDTSPAAEPASAPAPPATRSTSPWLWVLAAAAVAVVVAVAASTLRPPAVPADAADGPAPLVSAPTPTPAAPSPTAAPTVSAPSAVPADTPVPELAGLTLEAASAVLREAGLAPGAVASADGTDPAGTVLSSTPGAAVAVPLGSGVDLVVATGANAVPAAVGASEGDAVAAIRDAGFVPLVVRAQRAGAPGAVAAVRPAEGSRLPLGSSVELVVVDAGPSPSSTPRASATPTPDPTP
ncbi:serine/threonine-protein kinase [Microbacterium sp. 10M-3C3]|uniref:serine/threonine protein kinase n=1 Tax=Microbacterium sp. 10M-3C3 TaxID=2483401 RepID=UPI0013DE0C25|nr:serine/threonine-protein kinase [Microbacterium sp. 10M-3C3]